jgi:Ca-activated chloride channel family protein
MPSNNLNSLARTVRTYVAIAGCLSVALWPAIGHQEAQNNTSRESIKVSSVAVNVYAIAEDHHGRLLRDLTKDDFQLTDDSVPQKIEYFSRETNIALSLGLAIDTSVSQGRLLGAEQEAAKKFVSEVLRSGDQAFVMNFDADVNLLKDFTDAAIDLSEAIDSAKINDTGRSILQQGAVPATGGTHLYDAVYLASSELMKDVIVYSIILSDPELYSLMGTSYHGDRNVRKIARETGGGTIRVRSAEQIGQAFEQIARELRSQYRLGYYPSDLRHDGSFRRIQVKVRGHNYNVRTRTGYYDRSDPPAQTKAASEGHPSPHSQ